MTHSLARLTPTGRILVSRWWTDLFVSKAQAARQNRGAMVFGQAEKGSLGQTGRFTDGGPGSSCFAKPWGPFLNTAEFFDLCEANGENPMKVRSHAHGTRKHGHFTDILLFLR